MKQRMKRKTLRLYLLVASLCLLGVAVGLALYAFQSRIVFFFSPSDVAADRPAVGRVVRLGGLVEAGSLERSGDGSTIHFKVTDLKNTVAITFRGVLPDLFRESQGVVVEGAYGDDGEFTATEVLAKHDEKYMPPEVAKALKESGRWQEGATAEPASPGSDAQPAAATGTTTGTTSGTTSGTNP